MANEYKASGYTESLEALVEFSSETIEEWYRFDTKVDLNAAVAKAQNFIENNNAWITVGTGAANLEDVTRRLISGYFESIDETQARSLSAGDLSHLKHAVESFDPSSTHKDINDGEKIGRIPGRQGLINRLREWELLDASGSTYFKVQQTEVIAQELLDGTKFINQLDAEQVADLSSMLGKILRIPSDIIKSKAFFQCLPSGSIASFDNSFIPFMAS